MHPDSVFSATSPNNVIKSDRCVPCPKKLLPHQLLVTSVLLKPGGTSRLPHFTSQKKLRNTLFLPASFPPNGFLPNLLAAPFPFGHFMPTFVRSFAHSFGRMESGDAVVSNTRRSPCSHGVLYTLSGFTWHDSFPISRWCYMYLFSSCTTTQGSSYSSAFTLLLPSS